MTVEKSTREAQAALMKRLARKQASIPDERARTESTLISNDKYVEKQREMAEIAGIRERNRDRRINRKLRTNYAKSVFCYLIWYSVFVGVLLVLHGFKVCSFELPESVLSFLVGSTAASAIGLVFSVTHGLFNGLEKGSK